MRSLQVLAKCVVIFQLFSVLKNKYMNGHYVHFRTHSILFSLHLPKHKYTTMSKSVN